MRNRAKFPLMKSVVQPEIIGEGILLGCLDFALKARDAV